MGRIGLFGGTFDPPHAGHLKLAGKIFKKFSLDELIFIPAGNPPHKTEKKITDKHYRYEMVKLLVDGTEGFSVSDFDLKSEMPNYSYITIEHFKGKYPNDEVCFIVGADSYRDFPLWKNYPEILSLCTFIVAGRDGIDTAGCYSKYKRERKDHKALFLDDFSYKVSSTDLRENLKSGKLVRDIPDEVLKYININNLY